MSSKLKNEVPFENAFSRIWKKNGIIYCRFKKEVIIDYKVLYLVSNAIQNILNGEECRIIIDCRRVKYVTTSGRNIQCHGMDMEFFKSDAIIYPATFVGEIIVEHIKLNTVFGFPINFFKTEIEAKKWFNSINQTHLIEN